LAEEFIRKNAVIIGVSMNSVESHKKFKKDNNLPFTLLSDPDAKVIKEYGAWEEKLYGKTIIGVVNTTFLIDENGKIISIYKDTKPEEHAEKCLLDLKDRAGTSKYHENNS